MCSFERPSSIVKRAQAKSNWSDNRWAILSHNTDMPISQFKFIERWDEDGERGPGRWDVVHFKIYSSYLYLLACCKLTFSIRTFFLFFIFFSFLSFARSFFIRPFVRPSSSWTHTHVHTETIIQSTVYSNINYLSVKTFLEIKFQGSRINSL